MAWLGKVTLGNFGDIAGAVTKISESVKNLEKNFDSALGFDERGKSQDEAQSSTVERVSLLEPVFAFVSQKEPSKDSRTSDVSGHTHSSAKAGTDAPSDTATPSDAATDEGPVPDSALAAQKITEEDKIPSSPPDASSGSEDHSLPDNREGEHMVVVESEGLTVLHQSQGPMDEAVNEEAPNIYDGDVAIPDAGENDETGVKEKEVLVQESPEEGGSSHPHVAVVSGVIEATTDENVVERDAAMADVAISTSSLGGQSSLSLAQEPVVPAIAFNANVPPDLQQVSHQHEVEDDKTYIEKLKAQVKSLESALEGAAYQSKVPHQHEVEDDETYIEKLKAQVKSLESALEGAAYQSKVKADELSRLSLENDSLRYSLEETKKTSDAEFDTWKEEFQQRLSAAERKVYALTKERDMLRREQSRRDSTVLLKEKDEIIKQVMAEGEELSKKQAAQEAQMRKLRAQIRELEEEKQRLKSKLQVEEATVKSIRKDKAATEKALQEAVERTQVELAIQKEFYTNALNEAKEAEARAELRVDTEAKLELEHRLHEAADREVALIQSLEELRQALSRAAQQAVSREDMLRRDVEELERRCQAAELRYEELVASVPESTRPLLRQIEAMQGTMGVRAEAWSGVERALNARLQEAEAKAAASQERERAMNERLTQTTSRMAVLEAQVSCLKAEQAQLSRSLEKERQRASENRQEYLAAIEAAATHEGHAKQLEDELKELRSRFKRELAEERTLRELLQQEVEREKQKAAKQQMLSENGNWPATSKANVSHAHALSESSPGRSVRRFSSSSNGSLEESFFLQASLDPMSDHLLDTRRNSSAGLQYIGGKSVSVEQLEAFLSQKDGELALYTSRLASLESTRDALAEELVKATTQCEKLRMEAASLPSLRAELESLRQRHTSALELMGERDEQVEELKADLADVKEMYREQIDMLVNQIEQLSARISNQ